MKFLFHSTFQDQFAKPSNEVEVSNLASLAQIFRGGLDRIEVLNWLDPLRSSGQLHRQNPFALPTQAELRLGWRNRGGVRVVNCLNTGQTQFPRLTLDDLRELGAGPYLLKLARSYLTSYRVNVAQNLAYLNLDTYHADRSQPNMYIQGFIFDQQQVPVNWYGIWGGTTTPNVKPWEPLRIIMLPRLPSRYKSNCDHTVLVAYVPQNLPLLRRTPGLTSPDLQKVKMWICGPRTLGKCKAGSRTFTCCAHVMACLYTCGFLAYNPGLWRTAWRSYNFLDAGAAAGYNRDLLTGLYS